MKRLRIRSLCVLILFAGQLATAQSPLWEKLTEEGRVALFAGRYADAEARYRAALDQLDTAHSDTRLPATLNSLAGVYIVEMRYQEAEALCTRGLALGATEGGQNDVMTAALLRTLGVLYRLAGRSSESERCIRRAISILEKQNSPKYSPVLAILYHSLGLTFLEEKKYTLAKTMTQRGLAISQQAEFKDDGTIGGAISTLATLYQISGNFNESERLQVRALALLEKAYGRSSPVLVNPLSRLGALYVVMKKYPEAAELCQRAIAIGEGAAGTVLVNAEIEFGWALSRQGRNSEAEPHFNRALALIERCEGNSSAGYGLALKTYAEFLRLAKRPTEASKAHARAMGILESKGHRGTVDVAELQKR
jgi:tetratricopeptide (TPR) repeat protein